MTVLWKHVPHKQEISLYNDQLSKIISSFTHGRLRMEEQIQTIDKMKTKDLTGKREMQTLFPAVAAYAINTFAPPSLSGISLPELVFIEKLPGLLNLTFLLLMQFANTHKNYLKDWKKKQIYSRYFTII